MILVGSQRSGAAALADHLTNDLDNDHVTLLEVDGFLAEDLHGALQEIHAVSKGTRCKQYLFSLSLNPPQEHIATEDEFREAADRAGKRLGLDGQPRALIMHEKEGRRHAHVVWSRIDVDEMKAINLPHYKLKLRDLARDLHLDHGWVLPNGLQTYGGKDPLNFTLAEWQQARRQGIDPREIKQIFREAWERSDSLAGLSAALSEKGFHLARGDRRGVIALDVNGQVYSLPRWSGVKAKELREKVGDTNTLGSVTEVSASLKRKMTSQVRNYIEEIRGRHIQDLEPFYEERTKLVLSHREERTLLRKKQSERWAQEAKTRSERLNGGLKGLFDRLTGQAKSTRLRNETEAMDCARRDQAQRDRLVVDQMLERRALQERVKALKAKHTTERSTLARSIAQYLRRDPSKDSSRSDRLRNRSRHIGLDLDR